MKKDIIPMIMGGINGTIDVKFWIIEEDLYSEQIIGDYAIVEYGKGYDLVEILGVLKYKRNMFRILNDGTNITKVVKIIKRSEIKGDKE